MLIKDFIIGLLIDKTEIRGRLMAGHESCMILSLDFFS